jgi:hypothetical protein
VNLVGWLYVDGEERGSVGLRHLVSRAAFVLIDKGSVVEIVTDNLYLLPVLCYADSQSRCHLSQTQK